MGKEKAKDPGGVGLPVGSKIGKYEIRQKLGIGGQAIVYKGYDALLDRFVAIKQISTHLAEDPKFLERFRKEAQVLARLGAEQSAIVTIHELIEDQHGLFIVMEFVAGRSLENILEENTDAIEPKAALQLLWRLAAALHAVHSAGIIHRDLKPSNILISEGLRPTVTDFGVAASSSGQTSMLLGTTKYMAPELFASGTVDGRADMYSLGFVAYEMLAGRAKFREIFSDIVRDRHTEALRWMKWHGNESVQAPPLHGVNPRVPEVLSNIVARMIAKNLDDRFESMEALGRAIKISFSPHARAGSAVGAPAVTAPPPPTEDIGPGDEGDELEVEPHATAPIPKSTLSMRTKLILLGVILLTAIGFGVGMAVRKHLRDVEARNSAEGRFATIMRLFERKGLDADDDFWDRYDKDRNYEEALKEIAGLRKLFPASPEVAKASVIALFCKGHIAVAEEDWPSAKKAENDAGERLNEIQRALPVLYEWCGAFRERVDMFRAHRIKLWTFSDVMRKVRELIAAGQLDKALAMLNDDTIRVDLPRAQEQAAKTLIRQIEYQLFDVKLREVIARADRAYQDNDAGAAAVAYQNALDILGSEAAAIMPRSQRVEHRKHITDRLSTLKSAGERAALTAAVAEARKSGDKRKEVKLLEELQKRWPSDNDARRIKQLLNELEFAEFEQAIADDNREQALAILDRILERDPKYPPAVERKRALTMATQRVAFIQAANAAFAAKDFAKALQLYEQAANIQLDADLTAKMDECGFAMGLAQADKEAAGKNYARAIDLYTALGRKYAAKKAIVDARIQSLNTQRQFTEFITAGDDALEQREWYKARQFYKEAETLIPSRAPEVKAKIRKALYMEALDHGQEALIHSDFDTAIAHFKRALGKATGKEETDRAQELIAEAERRKRARLNGTE